MGNSRSTSNRSVSSVALAQLRMEVLEANLELVRRGLVLYTFGNASGILREEGLVVIKPSGVPYEKMKPERGPQSCGRFATAVRSRCRECWLRTTVLLPGAKMCQRQPTMQ